MKTQEQFAEEILEQCQNGASVSDLMATLGEYKCQLIGLIDEMITKNNQDKANAIIEGDDFGLIDYGNRNTALTELKKQIERLK